MLLLADKWKDYELIDMGNGEKLERWGSYVLRRPDPQVVWPMESEWALWKNPSAGAEVCHVDAAKGMVNWAKENIELSGLKNQTVRFIVDDVVKFVEREIRRGKKYDAIIMDPPSYGRGPKGEVWQIEEKLYSFVDLCMGVLSDNPLFFLINSYTTGFSPIVLENVLSTTIGKKTNTGDIYGGELGIPASRDGKILPCGIFGRWEKK
ncbi:class I SAM-dependent methyltransferase [Clostridioides difficile]|nr:class I SAM-dependent methyltransferase [Clostridioides difficile]